MSVRNVDVLHIIFPRRIGGQTQVFFQEHPRWRESASGRPLLALPATKLSNRTKTDDPVAGRLQSVLNSDLGLTELRPAAWQSFDKVETRTVSPTHGVVSRYRIAPVLTRLPAITHGRAVRQARGRWLSPQAALARPDLSPTARAVLEKVDTAHLLPPAPSAADLQAGGNRAVAARLTAARDGDMEQFAAIVQELTPVLTKRLRRAESTRALGQRSHDLEDALAVAFTAALEHLEQFDPHRGSATGWLWIITRNAAVSLLRRDGRAGPLPPDVVEADAEEHDPVAILADREEIATMRARVEDALRQATPLMRRAWALRTDAGYQYEEIAEALKVPVGTIATWIRRIRQMAAGSLAGNG